MKNKRTVIIYIQLICQIGGAETWLYNLTTILKDDFDVLVLYDRADPLQLARLQVPSEPRSFSKRYYCDILLNCFLGRPTGVIAGHVVQMVHSNYSEMPYYHYIEWNKTQSYIFVSEAAKNAFPIAIRKPFEILENPVVIPKKDKRIKPYSDQKLHLLSATRLTEEKGGGRMRQLCYILDSENIDFVFDIWSTYDATRFAHDYGTPHPNMIFHQTKLDLTKEMQKADYVCQFSDCEAFCYTIHESLAVGTPVLVTDWKGVRNVVKNTKNGYIFSMDMRSSRPTGEQLVSIPNSFNYANKAKKTAQKWIDYLNSLPLTEPPRRPFNYFL